MIPWTMLHAISSPSNIKKIKYAEKRVGIHLFLTSNGSRLVPCRAPACGTWYFNWEMLCIRVSWLPRA